MLRVLGCITDQHDLRLVVLAGLLCMFACATAMSMIERARASQPRLRLFWLSAAGTVAGCGIWGTHFVAMLAFQTGLPVGYDEGLTALSVVIAAGMCTLGFKLALKPKRELLGGAFVGAAISAMHYVGMAAMRTSATEQWDLNYVAASIMIGVALTAIAMRVTLRSRTVRGYTYGALLFTLAICGMHFTGMAAVIFIPDPTMLVPVTVLDPNALAVAVAAGAILIVALGLTGAIVDSHLTKRAMDETERLRAHILELEATKAQLEATSAHLAAALVSADAANVAKSEFLAAMGHELRTPLNAVIGFSQMILQEPFGPLGHARYREYINDIGGSGAHLLALINDVLDLSRLDVGNLKLDEETLSIEDIVDDGVRMMTSQAAAGGVKLAVDLEPGLPKLRADRRRLRQVLVNLLSNAVKFTPAFGSVQIGARLKDDDLIITIADTGIGIAPENVTKALERFGQVDSRLSRKYGGAGLGLPLAKELVTLHGGQLEILSEVGVGTTVRLTFPAERLEPVREAA